MVAYLKLRWSTATPWCSLRRRTWFAHSFRTAVKHVRSHCEVLKAPATRSYAGVEGSEGMMPGRLIPSSGSTT